MGEWIYESPDGGKTITRRGFMDVEGVSKAVMVEYQSWWDLRNLQELSRNLIAEQKLRDENPALMEMWTQYHTMLSLLKDH